MFRKIEDFMAEWEHERQGTLKLMRNMTDASLSQAIGPGGRTLGFLAWHLVVTFREMLGHTGISPDAPDYDAPVPSSAGAIATAYERGSASVLELVRAWTDDMLEDDIPAYGQVFKRGAMLDMLIRHEAHHRGQMTVLMRQAGVPVSGAYGPSREEWALMGMQPHA